MGRGGQKLEAQPKSTGLRSSVSKLEHKNDAELRKWATAYGLPDPDKAERSTLLKDLVSVNFA